ncbi:MAG TPA: porin [Leptospiraceae bacterium]|nr:porin [Leptospiraceae bacterium]HMX34288.1 porin [Leptospiraceae bacterium]HMY31681.1 porin [Leptospiraceae bacterium]HMZ67466.1 porin [Leptospiraceae bacterium]HNA08933.1 porin [Leptospiraceae bacterium]
MYKIYLIIFFLLSILSLSAQEVESKKETVPEKKEEVIPSENSSKKEEKPTEALKKEEKPAEPPQKEEKPVAPPKTPNASVDTRLGRGLYVKTEDSQFTMQMRARIQARYTYQAVSEDSKSDQEGAEIRRLRLVTRGNIYGKEWTYYIQLGVANQDMETRPIPLRDAVINYNKWSDFRISMGQMKVPFNRQRLTSSSALQMVDRSIVNSELNLDRNIGIQVFSENFLGLNRKFGYNLGVFHGNGRNTNLKPTGLLWVGKFTYSPFGGMTRKVFNEEENDSLSESDLSRSSDPRLAISVSVAKNNNTDRSQSTIGTIYQFAKFDYNHQCVDVFFKWGGFSMMGELIRRVANAPYQEKEDTTTGRLSREYSRSAEGFFIQAGYLFPNYYEVSMRYGEYRPIGKTDPNLVTSIEQGVGLSKYFEDHNLKVQADFFQIKGTPAIQGETYQFRIQTQVFY